MQEVKGTKPKNIFIMVNNNLKINWASVIENSTRILTALIAAGGFIWGIIAFQTEQRTNETLEFRRRLWEKRLDTYNKLSDIVGDLVVSRDNPQKFDSLQSRFEFLYYSSMVMVEDSLVEQKMITFLTSLNDHKLGRKSPLNLKSKALELMNEIGKSLKRRQDLLYEE